MSVGSLSRKYEQIDTFSFFLCSSDNFICPPSTTTTTSNPCHFQSQHTTKCRADSLPLWVALFPIFSPPQPTHHLRRKEKTFVQKTKKQTKKLTRLAKGREIFPSSLVLKGQKRACRCREETWCETKRASSTSFVALKWLSLFSFLSFSLGERGSALRVLHRNHGAHNNRRKPVTWVTWVGQRGG